jgi:hypothetical protein
VIEGDFREIEVEVVISIKVIAVVSIIISEEVIVGHHKM